MELDDIRKKLDAIDSDIIRLLDERFAVTDEVARYKDARDIPLTDRPRERALIDSLKQKAHHPGLKEQLDSIYMAIINANKLIRGLRRTRDLPFHNIGIIGIGTIGGAIIKAVKTKNPQTTIHALKRSQTTSALTQHYIDNEYTDVSALANACDLIIIASPIDTVIPYARTIASCTKDLVVIDVASVKTEIAAEFEKLTVPHISYVLTHPMAGSEKQGFEESRATLFVGRPWAITPHAANTKESIDRVSTFIEFLGSTPVTVSPSEHDRRVAMVSHLIFFMSTYLFAYAKHDGEALSLAGSGFEGTTRLASGNVSMHEQIAAHNRENIQQALDGLFQYISEHPITDPDLFAHAKMARDEFYKDA